MDDKKGKNGQYIQQKATLSILDKKQKEFLDEIENLLEKMGKDFGPVFQEELQRRLEFVVKNFAEELKILFSKSFEKWKVKDAQIRDLMDDSIQMPESHPKINNPHNPPSTPEFIKNVKFGPVRPK